MSEGAMESGDDLEALLWAVSARVWHRISHDANNRLSTILGHSEIALQAKQPERMIRALEVSVDSAMELRAAFMSLSDLMRGARVREMSRANIPDSVRVVGTLLNRSLEKASIRVIEPRGSLPSLVCDRRAIGSAVAGLTLTILEDAGVTGGGEFGVSYHAAEGHVSLLIEASCDRVPQALDGGTIPERIEERLARAVARAHGGGLAIERMGRKIAYELSCKTSLPVEALTPRSSSERSMAAIAAGLSLQPV
jgi:hypothetical protein